MCEMVQEDGMLLEYANEEIKDDKEIVLCAVKTTPLSI